MYVTDLDLLRCPYCGGRLEPKANYSKRKDELEYAVVACACAEFPVTAGILNFGGKWGIGLKEAIAFLKKEEFEKACRVQMELESLPLNNPLRIIRKLALKGFPFATRLTMTLRQLKGKTLYRSNSFAGSLQKIGKDSFNTYLQYRFSLPSFYKAMPLLIYVKEQNPKVILDLGCGAGHYSMVLDKLCPQAKMISMDQYYTYLFLAKRFLTSKPCYICHDISDQSPVTRGSVDVLFCSDVLKSQVRRKEVVSCQR